MNTAKPLCIYHANCADGFGAAWVVWKYFHGNVDFHPGVYGKPPPDVAGRDVIIVDFSYKRPVLEEMGEKARLLLVLDHHKSAEADLEKHACKPLPYEQLRQEAVHWEWDWPYIKALFDMNRSGARITWDFFYPDHEPPELLLHIEDRDLWRFNMDKSKEIHAALMSHSMDFETWDHFINYVPVTVLKSAGTDILRAQDRQIHDLIDSAARRMTICGHDVPVLNCPPMWASDAGNLLSRGEPFSATYYEDKDGVNWSLRSSDAGLDVAEIATRFGGGGHRNAAGFTTPLAGTASKQWMVP